MNTQNKEKCIEKMLKKEKKDLNTIRTLNYCGPHIYYTSNAFTIMLFATRLHGYLVFGCFFFFYFFFTVLFIVTVDFGAGMEAGSINYLPYNILQHDYTLLQKGASIRKAHHADLCV